ncbi:MAG: LytTR family transcriptional regulator [Acetatifactor sp.]|nr:LytTR family transcriptional regulator [Acetatifactor sp.]
MIYHQPFCGQLDETGLTLLGETQVEIIAGHPIRVNRYEALVTLDLGGAMIFMHYTQDLEEAYRDLLRTMCLTPLIYLHTEKETILLDGKLKVWQEKMQEAPMIRIHKSYIVNLKNIAKWEHDKVTLSNKETLPIGRHYANESKSMYMSFLRKQR